jgi:peptide/nickel transport system ATP-binding protein
VVIAQAISCQPGLLIADEPTASLDAATEEEILRLLGEMKERQKLALLFITHDPKILTDLADRIAVMYAGRIVEEQCAKNVLKAPLHPYAQALLACVPPERGEGRLARGQRLFTIPGNGPDPAAIPRGCSFAPRCSSRLEVCEQEVPQPKEMTEEGLVECFLYDR